MSLFPSLGQRMPRVMAMTLPAIALRQRTVLSNAAARLRIGLHDWIDQDVAPIGGAMTTAFVVGCGNSGTTLVAARLGLHPLAWTIPKETGIFRPRRRLRQARRKLGEWLDEAAAVGANVLIEKTPKHVHNVARIRRLLPDARVIAVVRNPFDTALSLTKRHGSAIDAGIERWLADNRPVLALDGKPGTTITRYERLTAEPEAEFRRLLASLGLEWDDQVLTARQTAYSGQEHRTRTMRLRTSQVSGPVLPNYGKWRESMKEREIDRVRARTRELFAALGGDPDTGEWR